MKSHEQMGRCPTCHRHHELASSKEGLRPVDGDVSVCWSCHALAVFDSTTFYGLRKPTQAELLELADRKDVQVILVAIGLAATPSEAFAMLVRRNGATS